MAVDTQATRQPDQRLETRRFHSRRGSFIPWLLAGLLALSLGGILPFFRPTGVTSYSADTLGGKPDSSGFFDVESDAAGHRYVWTGPTAQATFDFESRQPLTIIIAVRNAAVSGGPDSAVRVLVNKQPVAELHPAAGNPDFQSFTVRIPHTTDRTLDVTLETEPFHPRPPDPRTLGTMVARIAVDRHDAWASFTDSLWLYVLMPALCVVVALSVAVTRFGRRYHGGPARALASMGYLAVPLLILAAGCMAYAAILLLRAGVLDRTKYFIWLGATLYLGCFLAALALALPLDGRDGPSILDAPVWLRRRGFGRNCLLLISQVGALIIATLFALSFFNTFGTGDVQDKLNWMAMIRTHGMVSAYQAIPDKYPPGTLAILAAFTKAAHLTHAGSFHIYKTSLAVAFLLTGAIFVFWKRNLPLTIALLLAMTLSTITLGYNDVFFAPPLLLALWALERRRFGWFSALFALTCLIKWQPAVVAPIIAIFLFTELRRTNRTRAITLRTLGAVILPSACVGMGTLSIFGIAVLTSLRRAIDDGFLSANALNFNWVLTAFVHHLHPGAYGDVAGDTKLFIDASGTQLIVLPKVLFALIYVVALVGMMRGRKTFGSVVRWSLVAYLGYFMFNTGVHENHLFLALILGGVLAAQGRTWSIEIFSVVAVMTNVNLVLFYGIDGVSRLPPHWGVFDLSVALAAVNVLLYLWLLRWAWSEDRSKRQTTESVRAAPLQTARDAS